MWPTLRLLPLLLSLLLAAVTAAATGQLAQGNRLLEPVKTCPRPCGDAQDLADWNVYHSTDDLAVCPEPILLTFNLHTPINNPTAHTTIRACTIGNAETKANFLADTGYVDPDAEDVSLTSSRGNSPLKRGISGNATCGSNPARETIVSARISWWDAVESPSEQPLSDVSLAMDTLAEYMQQVPACDKKIAFTYVRGTLVGLYAGDLIEKRKTPSSLIKKLSNEIKTTYSSGSRSAALRMAVEVCGDDRSAPSTVGVVADMSGDFVAVQKIVQAWSSSQCISSALSTSSSKNLAKVTMWSFDSLVPPGPSIRGRQLELLEKRDECRFVRIEDGDDCPKLASRCGLALFAFILFNNKANPTLCSNPLKKGQAVCCSSGTVPNVTPGPGADGTCATYQVKEDEGCDAVATKHGISIKELESFNKKTWGWDGCKNLQIAQRVCVSKGNPAMPAPVKEAECGPTKPGTKAPSAGKELADLNPCPLDVCCNVWGNCGTTKDFCVVSKTESGNPGTSKPGENGCISNCGMKMINNDKPPAQYRKVGYFEAWNNNRPCLNMDITDIGSSWTHVHFAFGEISTDYKVVIPSDQQEQWDSFIAATDFPKKILAFGGWAFSNEGPNARLLRDVVSPANRGAFSDHVVRFAIDNNLSGLDFDWEYPGATDIEGSPPGQEEDGENYYQFLKLVREKLPKDKSLSIAAPASYWYLKGFPIKKMAQVLDYIVYMTYDFHGQWDVGNKFASDGCPAGNCLRSHVNSTITHDSLVMITKAGVPSHKVVVGVSSYGRSFKMSDSTCRGPMCTFLGKRNESPAKKGRCTETGGYISDFEINEIIKRGGLIKSWYDESTDSDYLVYDQVEWVAYMSTLTKQRRIRYYKNLNFGGTSDWAIDLQGEGSGAGKNKTGRPVYLDPKVYDDGSGAKCHPPCVLVFPPSVLPRPTTVKPGKYTSSLEYGASGRTTINGKETTAFVTKTTTITIDIPAITISTMSFSNINITAGQGSTTLFITPSMKVGPVSLPVPDGEGGTTTRTLILPPWPAITMKSTGASPTQTGPTSRPGDGTEGPGPQPTGDDDGDDDGEEWEFPPDDLPYYTTYPPHIVTPIPRPIKEIEPEDDGFVTPCDLWFFNLCPNNDKKFKGLKWTLPPGIYPPGPPPPSIIGPPPGPPPVGGGSSGGGPGPIIGPPPPWPAITVGSDNKPTFSEKPDCETESASLCSTTTTLAVTTIGPTTTTVTSTRSGCDTIYGCSMTDWETQITTRTDACELPIAAPTKRSEPSVPLGGLDVDEARVESTARSKRHNMMKRQNPGCDLWYAVVPEDMYQNEDLRAELNQYGEENEDWRRIGPGSEGYNHVAAFFVVRGGDHDRITALKNRTAFILYSSQADLSGYHQRDVRAVAVLRWNGDPNPIPRPGRPRRSMEMDSSVGNASTWYAESGSSGSDVEGNKLKRDGEGPTAIPRKSPYWAPSHISIPRDEEWKSPGGVSFESGQPPPYRFHYSESRTADEQWVYIIGERMIYREHQELSLAEAEGRLVVEDWDMGIHPKSPAPRADNHGTGVTAMVIGDYMGTCRRCYVTFVRHRYNNKNIWQLIDDLFFAFDDILPNGFAGRVVINMSFGWKGSEYPAITLRFGEVMKLLEDELGIVFVVAAGNAGRVVKDQRTGAVIHRPMDLYPAKFGINNELGYIIDSLITVGATDSYGQMGAVSEYDDGITTFAPGYLMDVPIGPNGFKKDAMGTSFAAPMTAGVVAYLRSLDSPHHQALKVPLNAKKLIRALHRRIRWEFSETLTNRKPVVWNGQIGELSCIVDSDRKALKGRCENIDLDELDKDNGETVLDCDADSPMSKRALVGRADTCPIESGRSGRKRIAWSQGPDSPKCPAGTCGGELCRGYYCSPDPKGTPPDFRDPKDPNGASGNPIGNGPPPEKSTTTTAPKPTKTATAPDDDDEKDDAPKNFIMIVLAESSMPINGMFSRSWQIWPSNAKKGWYACGSKPDKPVHIETAATDLNSMILPTKLGPFTANGYDCVYEADARGRLGIVKCDGVKTTGCQPMNTGMQKCGDTILGGSYKEAVFCSW